MAELQDVFALYWDGYMEGHLSTYQQKKPLKPSFLAAQPNSAAISTPATNVGTSDLHTTRAETATVPNARP